MECSNAWWPMEGFIAWWPMEGEGKTPFHFFPLSPQQILLKPTIFSFDLKVLLYFGSRPLFTNFLPFPWFINYNCASPCNKSSTPSLSIWFWFWFYFFHLLEIMASHMVTSYRPQVVQMNEESPPESSLDLTLTQHPRNEDPKLWKMCVHLEVEPPRT